MAASVSTFVVSCNDAAERNDAVARAAGVGRGRSGAAAPAGVQPGQLGRVERALVDRVARLDAVALGGQQPRPARELVLDRLRRLLRLRVGIRVDEDARATSGLL